MKKNQQIVQHPQGVASPGRVMHGRATGYRTEGPCCGSWPVLTAHGRETGRRTEGPCCESRPAFVGAQLATEIIGSEVALLRVRSGLR
jgi:hypothetical protein